MTRALQARLALAALVALLAFDVVVGVIGIPFGEHWDEWYARKGTENAVRDVQLFPGDFTYNGVYFDLAAAPAIPRMLKHAPPVLQEVRHKPTRPLDLDAYPSIGAAQQEVLAWVGSDDYIHTTRTLFLLLTLLALPCMYFALRPGAPAWAAFGAAAFMGLSWEVGSHARYIAVDSIMMMLSAAMLMAMMRARATSSALAAQAWWAVAGIAGGLAVGCKVTGLFFCVPIGVGALLSPGGPGWPARVRRCAWGALWYALAFVISTPGVVRDPLRFLGGVAHTAATYADAPKFAYRVDGLPDMLLKMSRWLFGAVPSPWLVPALLLGAVCVVGFVRLWRVDRPLAVIVLSFVLAYLVPLLRAGQLVVRNALPLVPVLALGFGLGVWATTTAARHYGPRARAAWLAVLLVIAAANASFLVWAALSVRTTTPKKILDDTARYLNDHADQTLYASPKLMKAIGPVLESRYTCAAPVSANPKGEGRVALQFDEHNRYRWQSNWPGFYEKHFSSWETNLDYYANWRARHFHHRTVVLSLAHAQKNAMKLKGFMPCTPKGG